jgi:hypothetical protein
MWVDRRWWVGGVMEGFRETKGVHVAYRPERTPSFAAGTACLHENQWPMGLTHVSSRRLTSLFPPSHNCCRRSAAAGCT